mmetsp:Transcript_29710/g.65846  ORF Transcript_29710/g.65846 Transcript_29710/m.65846 type:complete len:588 (+) Transcript_29710:106-1869(+)
MGKPGTKHSAINKKSNSSDNPDRVATKGNMRSKSTIARLLMYRKGKAVRDKDGKVIGGSLMMPTTAGGKAIANVARIAPNRKWFGNTRIISQNELDNFREEMTTKEADPYSIVLRRKKIPMALLQESETTARVKILDTETYQSVFGSKMTRKRPKLSTTLSDYGALMATASQQAKVYDAEPSKDSNVEVVDEDGTVALRKDDLFAKGQSKRIWGELYKVLDCSDVILEIVDARNVPGTRCSHIERHIKKNASHKQLVIVLNKCDLVPNWVTRKWVKILSAEFPCLAFHASLTNAFGKGALISLLRQFGKLHADKRQISVGVIGYPNTGKSSVINSLMGRPCCRAAPIPGETKVWQYITLTKRIFLIDSPGVVYDCGDDEVETVLKGVVRAERLSNPQDYVAPILDRVSKEHIVKKYGVKEWTSDYDFVCQLALLKGKLMKGGEPDCDGIAKIMIYDWQRGKLPFFVPPPRSEITDGTSVAGGDSDEDDMDEGEGGMEVDSGDDDEEEEEKDFEGGGEDEEEEEEAEDDVEEEVEEEEEEEEEVVVEPVKVTKGSKRQATSPGDKSKGPPQKKARSSSAAGAGSWEDL